MQINASIINRFCLIALALFSISHASFKNCQAAGAPNIVLMMADDLGWGDVGFNGSTVCKTPHLDQMTKDGLKFERFYSASAVCSPTRASALTGRNPTRQGIPNANSGHMLPEELTMGEALKSSGYTTGHFGKWHLGTLTTKIKDANRGKPGVTKDYAPPWEHGFDVCFSTESKVPTWDPMKIPTAGCGASKGVGKGAKKDQPYGTYYWTGEEQMATDNLEGDDSRVIMDRAIPFIEDAVKAEKPFFSIVWFHTPHLPTISGGKYLEMYKGMTVDEQHYFGAITAMDEQIGRLRGKLEELGVAKNTLVFFCSDNGPENRTPGTAGPLRARKRALYEGGIRVPGVAVWPAVIKAGSVTDIPCVTSDYLPTVAEATGASIKQAAQPQDGISLMPLFKQQMKERPAAIAFQFGGKSCLIDNRFKLYREKGKVELYDIPADAGEANDVASKHSELVQEMTKKLDAWQESCKRSNAGEDYR